MAQEEERVGLALHLKYKIKFGLVQIRSYFVTGIFVVIPIFLSLWIAWTIYSKLTEWGVVLYGDRLVIEGVPEIVVNTILRLGSLVVMLLALFVIGLLTKITLGVKLIRFAQRMLLRLPIVNFIYSTCKQIGDAIWTSKGGNMFHQVVLFEYPRKGCWAIGFLTNENKEPGFEVIQKLNGNYISVFIPTTPNPTSGFLMYVPREECHMLDMSVSDAMKLIVSCGAVIPPASVTEKADKNHV